VSPGRGGGDATQTVACPVGRVFSDGLSRLGGRCGVRRLRQPSGSHAGLRKGETNSGNRGVRILRGALYDPGLRFYLLARSNERRQDRLRLLESDRGRSFRSFRAAAGSSASASGYIALNYNGHNDNERSAHASDNHATSSADCTAGAAGACYRPCCSLPTSASTGSARTGSSGIGCPGTGARARAHCQGPGIGCGNCCAESGSAGRAAARARPAHRSPSGSGNFGICDPACFECPGSGSSRCTAESGCRLAASARIV